MRAFWTFIFIAACVIIFPLEFFVPINYFSFIPAYALTRPWTFVTSIFLHANIEHLFFNMFALFIFGTFLESRIRQRDFVLIFFLTGIAGNLGYMITAPSTITPAIGASGSIYGIMGTLTAFAPSAIIFIGVMPLPIVFASFIWGLTEFLGLFAPGSIAHGAHLAGLFIGIFFGLYLRSKFKSFKRKRISSF